MSSWVSSCMGMSSTAWSLWVWSSDVWAACMVVVLVEVRGVSCTLKPFAELWAGPYQQLAYVCQYWPPVLGLGLDRLDRTHVAIVDKLNGLDLEHVNVVDGLHLLSPSGPSIPQRSWIDAIPRNAWVHHFQFFLIYSLYLSCLLVLNGQYWPTNLSRLSRGEP